ncbi:MAG TPA: hypothetical protein VLK84_32030 [Longimicrobium sp.]|nr:hypothetical protein [Longimicrobium sp.]
MRILFIRLTCLAALALAAACSGATDPDQGVREPSVIQFYDAPPEITLPATVRAGETFSVAVMTWAGGCSRPDGTETTVSGATADVRPYDFRFTGVEISCPDVSRNYVHETPVRFNTPGQATVRVHGIREPGGETVVLTRAITVQPAG